MITMHVARKTLKEVFRRPKYLATMLGIPLAFMFIFGAAFGGTSETDYEIAIWNQDQGTLGATFVEELGTLEYGSGSPLTIILEAADRAEGQRMLEDADADILVVLPPDFSARLTGGQSAGAASSVEIVSDPSRADSRTARDIAASFTQAFVSEASGQRPVVGVADHSAVSQDLTDYDFIAPGLMVFAMLMLITHIASGMAREEDLHTLDRIRLAPVRAPGFLAGVAVAHIVLSAFALLLMLVAAEIMGFQNQGSFLAAYAISLIASVSVIGLGLIMAALVNSADEAGNVATLVSVPMSFLSGSFFEVPGVDLFQWGDTTVTLYDILPTTHAVQAMRGVLTFGQDLGDVGGRLIALGVLSVVYLGIGIGVYAWRRLRTA